MPVASGQRVPSLDLPTVGGGRFVLGSPPSPNFTLLVFYRGWHCRRCPAHLSSFQSLLPDFKRNGADVVAISSDNERRATQSVSEWKLRELKVAYGMPIEKAADWGLYVTDGKKPEDPAVFTEPALFIVDKKGILDSASINTGPRLRTSAKDALAHVVDRLAGKSD
jgi:peroxiredoxin